MNEHARAKSGYRIAALFLGALVVILGALAVFNTYALRFDTVRVDLNFQASSSARAQAVDEALLSALERGYFGEELRRRLNRPAYTVRIGRLWADACEVRQIDYERFVNWRRRSERAAAEVQNTAASEVVEKTATDVGETESDLPDEIAANMPAVQQPTTPSIPPAPLAPLNRADPLYSISSGHRIAGVLSSPASGITKFAADAYCQAAGGRLPWAEEWEALAVGREGRLYPWGDTFTETSWPYQDSFRNAAQPCATHPSAATPQGVHDLAGNVMEWSRGSARAHPLTRSSGAHGAPAIRTRGRALYALSSAWLEISENTRSHHLGFRCVYDQVPPSATAWGAKPRTVALSSGEYRLGVPIDLRLARVAVLLPPEQQRKARRLVVQQNKRAPVSRRQLGVTRCEISRAQYRVFLNHPLVRLGLYANEHEPRGQNYTPQNWAQQLTEPDLPVSGVNWWAADAFARWAGGRLPRAEEWQLLAAGQQANSYPWGDSYQTGFAVTGDWVAPDGSGGAQACGRVPRDISAGGVRDLAGNVSEWTLSLTAERGDYAAWVQGGNWRLPGERTTRSVFGRPMPLNHRSPTIGFRVVYD